MTRSEVRAAKRVANAGIRANLVRCRDAWAKMRCPHIPPGADFTQHFNAFYAQQQNMVRWIQKQIDLFDARAKAAKDKTSKAL